MDQRYPLRARHPLFPFSLHDRLQPLVCKKPLPLPRLLGGGAGGEADGVPEGGGGRQLPLDCDNPLLLPRPLLGGAVEGGEGDSVLGEAAWCAGEADVWAPRRKPR